MNESNEILIKSSLPLQEGVVNMQGKHSLLLV